MNIELTSYMEALADSYSKGRMVGGFVGLLLGIVVAVFCLWVNT